MGLKGGPGDHACWQCSLYDAKMGVCRVIVDRGKHAPRDDRGIKITELRRVWPFDFCIRFLDQELGRIVIFDPDAREHKEGMEEVERETTPIVENEDQMLMDIVSIAGNKKSQASQVFTEEPSSRGDSWRSTNARSAAGRRPTNPNSSL